MRLAQSLPPTFPQHSAGVRAFSTALRCIERTDALLQNVQQKGPFCGPFAMELNGARSNPRLQVQLARLERLHARLLRKAAASPRQPRSAPATPSPVLATVTCVLELAGRPMQAREIHAAAEQLVGKPLLRTSVKGTLAAYAFRP